MLGIGLTKLEDLHVRGIAPKFPDKEVTVHLEILFVHSQPEFAINNCQGFHALCNHRNNPNGFRFQSRIKVSQRFKILHMGHSIVKRSKKLRNFRRLQCTRQTKPKRSFHPDNFRQAASMANGNCCRRPGCFKVKSGSNLKLGWAAVKKRLIAKVGRSKRFS